LNIPTVYYRPLCLWVPGWKPDRRPLRWQITIPHDIAAYNAKRLGIEPARLPTPDPRKLPDWRRINQAYIKPEKAAARQVTPPQKPEVRTFEL